ncbi:hypothetical protein MMC06_000606 [Schaereria dolodes]|nr:hypothetical protein [Schaereria dolodes]
MSYTNSKTWISPELAEQERFEQMKKNVERMWFDRSPFVPHDFAEWINFRATSAVAEAEDHKARLAARETLRKMSLGNRAQTLSLPFDGKVFKDNLGPVLSQHTIWSPWSQTTEARPFAPWPSKEEMKEEGDERHTSGFGRFLAVPRVPGNETVAYKQKAFLPVYPMDHVLPVGTLEWGLVEQIFGNAGDVTSTIRSYSDGISHELGESEVIVIDRYTCDVDIEGRPRADTFGVRDQQSGLVRESDEIVAVLLTRTGNIASPGTIDSGATEFEPNELDALDQMTLRSGSDKAEPEQKVKEIDLEELDAFSSNTVCKSFEKQTVFLEALQEV